MNFIQFFIFIEVDIERQDLTLPSLGDESISNINLPPCNRDVSRVEDVYDTNDIVPQTKLETLYDVAESISDEDLQGYFKEYFYQQTNLRISILNEYLLENKSSFLKTLYTCFNNYARDLKENFFSENRNSLWTP